MDNNYGIFGRAGSLGALGWEASASASTSGGVSTSSSSGGAKEIDANVKHTHTDARENAPPPPPPPPSPWAGLLSRLKLGTTSPARIVGLPGLYTTGLIRKPVTTAMPATLSPGFKMPAASNLKIVGRSGGGLTSSQAAGGMDTGTLLIVAGVVAALGAGAYFLLRKK